MAFVKGIANVCRAYYDATSDYANPLPQKTTLGKNFINLSLLIGTIFSIAEKSFSLVL